MNMDSDMISDSSSDSDSSDMMSDSSSDMMMSTTKVEGYYLLDPWGQENEDRFGSAIALDMNRLININTPNIITWIKSTPRNRMLYAYLLNNPKIKGRLVREFDRLKYQELYY